MYQLLQRNEIDKYNKHNTDYNYIQTNQKTYKPIFTMFSRKLKQFTAPLLYSQAKLSTSKPSASPKLQPQKKLTDYEYINIIQQKLKKNNVNEALKYMINSYFDRKILDIHIFRSFHHKVVELKLAPSYSEVAYELYRSSFKPNINIVDWMNFLARSRNQKIIKMLQQDYKKIKIQMPKVQKNKQQQQPQPTPTQPNSHPHTHTHTPSHPHQPSTSTTSSTNPTYKANTTPNSNQQHAAVPQVNLNETRIQPYSNNLGLELVPGSGDGKDQLHIRVAGRDIEEGRTFNLGGDNIRKYLEFSIKALSQNIKIVLKDVQLSSNLRIQQQDQLDNSNEHQDQDDDQSEDTPIDIKMHNIKTTTKKRENLAGLYNLPEDEQFDDQPIYYYDRIKIGTIEMYKMRGQGDGGVVGKGGDNEGKNVGGNTNGNNNSNSNNNNDNKDNNNNNNTNKP